MIAHIIPLETTAIKLNSHQVVLHLLLNITIISITTSETDVEKSSSKVQKQPPTQPKYRTTTSLKASEVPQLDF